MKNTFRILYNEHIEYQELRSRKGPVYNKYIDDIKHWKVKYLEGILYNNYEINNIESILEVGCATGELLNRVFNSYLCKKYGVDISDENIKSAIKFFPNLIFFAGTFEEFVKQSNINKKFDIIILSDILEHVNDDIGLLKTVGQNAERVILNLPIEKVPEYRDRIYGLNDIEGHLRAYSTEEAIELCKNAEMQIVDYYEKQYVLEPVFRKYLLNKLSVSEGSKSLALYKYQQEIINIELNPLFYKRNFFALLKKYE